MTGIPPAPRYRIINDTCCSRALEEITAVMSPKLVAILVLAILSVSIVVTGAAAISAAQGTGQSQPVARSSGEQNEGDSAVVSGFKFFCPFH